MFLTFDIGGTKTRLAVSSDGKTIGRIEIFPTPNDFDELLSQFKTTFHGLTEGKKINAASGGVAGTLSLEKDTWVQAFKHPHWVGKQLKKELEKIVGASVHLENDAVMAALGEATFGAGKAFKIVVFLTVSTGLGGARIVNKKVDAKVWGFEPGKQIVDIDDTSDPAFAGKHLEWLVSGKSVSETYNQKPETIHDPLVWEKITNYLAIGVNNVITFWSPEVIVFGGSMMKSIDLETLKKYVKEYVRFIPELPELRHTELPEHSGLYGGLAYLKNL